METRTQVIKTFDTARSNLLLVIAFTTINVILANTNSDLFFLFSASIPIMLSALFGMIPAFVAIAIYVLCWALSKKQRAWIVVALVFFLVDVLFLLWIIFGVLDGFSFSILIELAFTAWVMFYLIIGTRAWSKLRTMPEGEDDITESEPLSPLTIPVAQMPPTPAIREANKKGKVIVSTNYNNIEISANRAFGVTELVVNGMVYAEKTGVLETKSYVLEANVNDIIVNATIEIKPISSLALPLVSLYVNGNLKAEKELTH